MKKLIWVIVVIVIVVIGFLVLGRRANNNVSAPSNAGITSGDTTAAINRDLESISVNDLNKEFQSVDADLNQL